MKDESVGQVLPDTQEEFPDESQEEAPTPELEQVAQYTSRKLLILLAVGAALLLVIHATPFGEHVRNWDALAELFTAGGLKAEIYFVLISSFLIMLGTPRLLFCALGGFAFGFWEGTFWSLLSNLIGSFLAFRAARWGGKAWLTERFGQRRFFSRIAHAKPTISSVAFIRMLPVSNAIINIGLALSHVGNRAFLLGSLIGFMPQGIVAVIIGSGMAEDVPWAGAAQIGIAGVLLLAILFWTSRQRRKTN
jgi:uncharacterized membrane protein YdjX (TVP38/TMEM64 family)